VKNSLTGFICTCLLVAAGSPPGRAQEKKPDPQSVEQAAPASPETEAARETPPPDQTPTGQQTPPQQAPPAGQTPTPPPEEEQPGQHSRIPELPPPPVKVPDVRRPGESGFWAGVEAWFPRQQPIFNTGNSANQAYPGLVTLQGIPQSAERLEVGAAVGLHNTLKFNFLYTRAAGDFTTPVSIETLGQVYNSGTYVSTNYRMESYRLSYEYLTWPYPVGSRKIRLKTLWQLQYTQINPQFDSPLGYFDSNGNIVLDTNGNPVNLSASRWKHIFSPQLGLAASYYPSRHFRVEVEGSGFGWPHHYSIWDADASLNYRVTSHFEVRAGERGFGFKTSTTSDYFVKVAWSAFYFGVRWYSNSE